LHEFPGVPPDHPCRRIGLAQAWSPRPLGGAQGVARPIPYGVGVPANRSGYRSFCFFRRRCESANRTWEARRARRRSRSLRDGYGDMGTESRGTRCPSHVRPGEAAGVGSGSDAPCLPSLEGDLMPRSWGGVLYRAVGANPSRERAAAPDHACQQMWRCARPRARSPEGDGGLCLPQLTSGAAGCGRDARAPGGRIGGGGRRATGGLAYLS
jgi:hypothetical protein